MRIRFDPGESLVASLALGLSLMGFMGVLTAGCAPDRSPPPAERTAVLLTNVSMLDGSGASARPAAIRWRDGVIVDVLEASASPTEQDRVIDGRGLLVTPGFVDTHSHGDADYEDHRDATAAVSQGITTIVVGQDGGSKAPLSEWLAEIERSPLAVNVASFSGHGTLRARVMGEDFRRTATPEEVEAMRQLLIEDMSAGALGLSTGLEYDPGIYSSTEEVIALAREAASWNGRYISHIRSEDRHFWSAIDEAITIGGTTGVPVQISHIKLAMVSLWGEAERLVERLELAREAGVDVTADIYPYPYWQSTLQVMFPERNFTDRAAAEFAITEVAPPDGMRIATYLPRPELEGKSLAEIAESSGTDPAQTLIDLIQESMDYERRLPESERASAWVESVIATSMDESDIDALMRWEHANICTDGSFGGAHPRGFGAFSRVLGRYVRERAVLSLEEAVYKMTGLAAEHMNIVDRGRILPGLSADLVLLDPEQVGDRSTTKDPHLLSVGIDRVWVAGELVFAEGRSAGSYPGRVLRLSGGRVSAFEGPGALSQ